MQQHFSTIAERYRELRTTDPAPVESIRKGLSYERPLQGLDVGCGTGRYTELLHSRLPSGSLTLATDRNLEMLRSLRERSGPMSGIQPVLSAAECPPVDARTLDWITTFNAVHHFDLPRFLEGMVALLRPGGRLWIYTRTPEQNARSVWGRLFPGFLEHERRLFSEAELRAAIETAAGLRVESTEEFRYERSSTRSRLVEQARAGHYSTFRLFSDAEFQQALETFESRLLEHPATTWTDANLLVACRRAS